MKIFLTCTLGAVLLWAACKSETSTKTAEASEKDKAELEVKETEPTDKQQAADAASLEAMAPPAENTAGPKGTITGSAVTMRKDASVQSDKLGAFDQNEKVEVLETKNVNNENEAILVKPISLYADQSGSGAEALSLPKGKAVIIESYHPETNKYSVAYMDTKKGKLYAQIDAGAVETITYSTWYRVKRSNGQTGWVLGKFLKTN